MTRLGIKLIDDEMGDIPAGANILLSVAPGIDPTPIGVSIAAASARDGWNTIYLTNNKPGSAIRREFDLVDSINGGAGNLHLLDAFSGMIGIHSEGDEFVQQPFDPRHIMKQVCDAVGGRETTFVLDNVSTMLDVLGMSPKAINEFLSALPKEVRTIALFSDWSYDEATVNALIGQFDAMISVKPVESITILKQMMHLRKVGWADARQLSVPIKILKPGGLRVYVPKILVTGPYAAGKSTMTRAISTQTVSVDRMGTTVAMDHGYLDYGGFSAEVYGTPGQEMFDPLLEYLSDEAVAIILVVDSSNPDTFDRAREMLEKTRALNLPMAVAANHSDSPKAVDPEIIRAVLKLPDATPIVRTVANVKGGVGELLDKLVEQITAVA
ncbi:MAG: ADP-ribosylation factor-like protein [Methanobacteriota archaeon]